MQEEKREPSRVQKLRARLRGMRRLGWYESFRRGPTMDGEPVPWLTYPAIFWLKAVCDGVGPVFEFGCGNSTLWWAKRSRRVVAVEYDAGWLGRIMEAKLSNLQVHRTPIESYSEALATSSERFEVIVIDGGSDRNACVPPTIDHLSEGGLVVFDDSHLPYHAEGIRLLHRAGFRRVDFVGPRPGTRFIEATSIFSHDLNRWSPAGPLMFHSGFA